MLSDAFHKLMLLRIAQMLIHSITTVWQIKMKSDVTPPPVTEETPKEDKKNNIEAEQEVFEEVEENAIAHQKEQNS